MKFLPSLRRAAQVMPATDHKSLQPALLEQKVVLADYYTSLVNPARLHDTARNWPIEKAVADGYDRVIWCYKAVATIGENTAREDVPFEVLDGPGEDAEAIPDHPIARLLNGTANPLETGEIFLERLSAQLLLSKKGAFVEIVFSNAGTPIRLDLLPPGRTRIVPGRTELIDCFEVTRLDGTRYFVPPERVRWIRKPHPIDPFCGVTPLEAAGLSLEMDYFARLYNVSFMKNDGRPGGIIGVRGPEREGGGLNEEDMEELLSRFRGGAAEAGRISVVEGDITYADLAAKPRDSSYTGVSANSKTEILAAFGVPESVLGNSSERTYANAEAEKYHFWVTTMLPHLSRIASGFLADVDEGQRCRFNVDKIDVLELPARERRREARDEVAAGLRSIKSYVDLAGRSSEVEDLPHTRALWMPIGKTPLPAQQEDADDLGQAPVPAEAMVPVDPNAPPAAAPAAAQLPGGPAAAIAAGPNKPGPKTGERDLFSGLTAPAAVPARRPAPSTKELPAAGWRPQARALTGKEAAPWVQVGPEDSARYSEAMLYGTLITLGLRWTARTAERLHSPRTRKGTRHYGGAAVSAKALDAAYCADEGSWAADAEAAARPMVNAAALTAAANWLAAVTGKAIDPGDLPEALAGAARDGAGAAVPALVAGAAWQARRAARDITEADAAGAGIEEITEAAAGLARDRALQPWASSAAGQAADAATEAGYLAAAAHWAATTGGRFRREWAAAEDCGRHLDLAGQVKTAGPFTDGTVSLRYPHDPLGGPAGGCQCRTVYSVREAAPGQAREAS